MTPQPPNMCPFCFETFASAISAAEHRVGNPRRCLTPDELVAAGMRKDRLGVWKRLRR
jgi:hypothetical protein